MALILDGKIARDFYKNELIKRVGVLKAKGLAPQLAIVQIGDNPESAIYIEQKKKFATAVGAQVDHIKLSGDTSQKDLAEKIAVLNADTRVHGIIIQLPIPASLDKIALMNLIDTNKDVDGLGDESQKSLDGGAPIFVPATAKGVMTLLDFYKIPVKGKSVVVFGRSRLVGHPLAALLNIRGARVSVCHTQTPNPQEISHAADVVIVAIGQPEHIKAEYIKEGAVVVDVGINSIQNGTIDKLEEEVPRRKVVGDVDFEAVSVKASAISPVPGGVGPMTVLSLLDNLILSVEKSAEKK
jgi:methylenetetrahydrofolate dehydrogenase (NADP+)/methenyltetrahydrofolate cyclohydrolase